MKRVLKIAGLILLLPAGAILTMLITSGLKHRYDDSGAGLFHGFVQARLYGQESFFFVRFEGETKPKWRWARPDNYKYQSLEIEWHSGDTRGKGVLDLSTLVLTTTTNSFALSETSLVNMLQPTDNQHAPSEPEIRKLYSLLIAAGKGELPCPRHHYHHFEEPLGGSMAHFSLVGWRIPYSVFAWCVTWVIIVAFQLIKQIRLDKMEQNK